MPKTKITLISILSLIILLSLGFALTYYSLGMKSFFSPKFQNVERKVFENTKSYSHGKIQDLAKYYEEYQKSDEVEKETIAELIRMNFANFNSEHIQNYKLKMFLTEIRGF